MAKKRITELATETTLKDGQYVAIDHATDGTKKYDFGGALTDLKEELVHFKYGGGGLTDEARYALLACFEKAAWVNENGQSYFDSLESALFPVAKLESISATFTQPSVNIYDDWDLEDLKEYLTVEAHYDDFSTQEINFYTLSGELSVGTSTITVSYVGKTTTFDVTVSAPLYQFTVGTHNFTSPAGTIETYNGNSGRIICSTNNSNDTHGNISSVNSNTSACNSTNNYITSQSLFTIPAGSTVKAKIVINHLESVSSTTYGSAFLRGTSNTLILNIAETSQIKAGVVDGTVFENSQEFQTATDVMCIGVYFGKRNSATAASIDVSFVIYVDDVRYV